MSAQERDALAEVLTGRAVRVQVVNVGTVIGFLRSESADHLADVLLAAGWTRGAFGGSSTCHACEHPAHGDTDCGVSVGYDHINGHHECGCSPDASDDVIEQACKVMWDAECSDGLRAATSPDLLAMARALAAAGLLATKGSGTDEACHCGEPVAYGYDGDPTHHRGMCNECDSVRCDAYPGACTAHALAAAGLLATRTEAEIKAEALREFADELAAIAREGNDDWWRGYEQAQLEAEEAAVRRADSLTIREDDQ